METSTKSSSINYGLYLGVILAAITVLCYAIKLELLVNFWLVLVALPILIIMFGVISVVKSRNILEGFISFKQAFSSYFITVAIGIIISTIISYLIFNFVDPEAALHLKSLAIEKTEITMKNWGAPLDEIAKQVEAMENQDSQSISAQLFSLAQSLVFFAVIGLIVALIMKRNPENA
ncbi:DUF4199 domain-containing protein [uncultured Lacinutrix sp.]|uniref:DUF4199 domain-containing protein n=1 Tax=uncultured Lacinutrix sp. TaxID=574032 RepID=UPI002628E8FE|nr:DUF4199 domain-containing protein [uncultured Lacinutrix sp.]